MFDLADFRAVDLGMAVAKRGGVQIDDEASFCTFGELRGEGVRGIRPPAVLVEKTRPFVGVQMSMDAIDMCVCQGRFFVLRLLVCMQTESMQTLSEVCEVED
jgi:hypothetical protein